jgi:hypothetical protein
MAKFEEWLQKAAQALKAYPGEALLGLVYFLIFVTGDSIGKHLPGAELEKMYFWFFPQFVLYYYMARRQKYLVPKILAWLLWVPLLIWGCKVGPWPIVAAYVLSIALLSQPFKFKDNSSFATHGVRVFTAVTVSIFIGIVAMMLVSLIAVSIQTLFDLKDCEQIYIWPLFFIMCLVIPLICCVKVDAVAQEPDAKPNSLVRTLVDWVLSPAIIIYSVVLYLYMIRILVKWELPDGGVAYMVGIFTALALIGLLVREMPEKWHMKGFFRYFPYIGIPPLVLLWIGTGTRIAQYGFTEDRFMLVISALLLTVFVIMLLFPRTRNFRAMVLALAASAIVFTWIPGISARDFGIRSQKARFMKVLPRLLGPDGRILEDAPYDEMAADSTLAQSWITASEALKYLREEMPKEKVDAIEEQYGKMVFSKYKIPEPAADGNDDLFHSGFHYYSIDFLASPIDIGEYTEVMAADAYYFDYDGEKATFYSDSHRGKVLLECDVAKRLDIVGASPDDVLVYSNEGYMAIFSSISDHQMQENRYTVGTKILLRKPL